MSLQGHAGFSLAAAAFFKLWPRETRCDGEDPRMVVLFELIDKAAEAAKASVDPTDTEILDWFEAQARKTWGGSVAWGSSQCGAPCCIENRNAYFPYETIRESAIAAMRCEDASSETTLSECANPECPVGCPESHATPPSYWAMVDADTEPDEPVVQEVNRG